MRYVGANSFLGGQNKKKSQEELQGRELSSHTVVNFFFKQ